MNTLRTLAWITALLMLALCCGPADAAKGGNGGGKPGGGGGDPPADADPAIAFVQASNSGADLTVMDADGANPTVLVADVDTLSNPSWSPDGETIVFSNSNGASGRGIYTVPADGSAAPTQITSTLSASYHNPSWSPTQALDGNDKIVWFDTVPYSNRYDIYVCNADGTDVVNLTADMSVNHTEPTWSRDGTKIVALRSSPRDVVVYQLGLDGGGQVTITGEQSLTDVSGSPLADLRCYSPAWARTSDHVLVQVYEPTADGDDDYNLWEIPVANPAAATRLTDYAASIGPNQVEHERHPDYSPDDTQIVFWWRRKGGKSSGLYVMNADGSGTPTRLLSGSGTWDPTWRP